MHTKTRRRWIKKNLTGSRKKTRVTVDFPIEKHRKLKAIAALRGETLQEFILHSVEDKITESVPEKSKLEILKEIGLLGAMEDSLISSTNYREFIMKSLKVKHEK